MKKLIIPFFIASLSFAAVAQSISLPEIGAPSELTGGEYAEGTMTRLSSAEVAEFLPWAQNARNQLNRAQTQALSLPLRERMPHIERAVRSVVARSGNRQYQSNMRYSLNRGLLLVDELEKNVNMNEIGSQESALDILNRSITIGLSFYESDLAFQQRAQTGGASTVIAHAAFGSAFMQGMYPGVVNVLDATAQYRLLYKLIEMVNWDLSRDAEAPRYAEAIVEAYEMGQDLPEQPSNDDKSNLRMIRRLNSLKIIALRASVGAIANNNDADIGQVFTPDPVQPEHRQPRNPRYSAFDYNSSTRYCYEVDSTGRRMGSPTDVVDINLCKAGVAAFDYNSSTKYCYNVDFDGKRLGTASDVVDADLCARGFGTFAYNSSSNYCYKVDRRGNRLGTVSDVVDSSRCIVGVATFAYNSSTNYCYSVDKDGKRLGTASDVVDIGRCRSSYGMFDYNSTTRYCYSVDARGRRLGSMSDIVDNSHCR